MRALLFSLLIACSSGADAFEPTTTAPPSDDQGAALAFAKSCVDQHGYKPVWNTTIAWNRVTATHFEGRRWVVDFPETGTYADGGVGTLGLPQGMMIDVDLDAKTCRQMMLE